MRNHLIGLLCTVAAYIFIVLAASFINLEWKWDATEWQKDAKLMLVLGLSIAYFFGYAGKKWG